MVDRGYVAASLLSAVLAVAGCGSQTHHAEGGSLHVQGGVVRSPLCGPGQCAEVTGTVLTCAAKADPRCSLRRVTSISALTDKNQVAEVDSHFVGIYVLDLQVSGMYTLVVRDGSLSMVKRRIRARIGRTVHANFVIQAKTSH
jgi:hypothetical protein